MQYQHLHKNNLSPVHAIHPRPQWLPALLALLLLCACQAVPLPREPAAGAVPVRVETSALRANPSCTDTFVEHALPFATGTRLREIRMYESNGAGVAANDLDGDGDLDLVFASIDRESAIFWNQGDLTFARQALDDPYTRGVNIIDVDGDGHLDITFTHRGLQSVSFWRNRGAPGDQSTPMQNQFVLRSLPGVTTYAYAMAWGDLNADGSLDLVTGSYNIDLIQHGIAEPESIPEAGVVVHLRQGDRYVAQPLAAASEALSVALLDLNRDGRLDIWAANDFDLPDAVWLAEGPVKSNSAPPVARSSDSAPPVARSANSQTTPTWTPAQPFDQMSHSTMSIEWGDLANAGQNALLTTDMMPYNDDPETQAAWQPVMEGMMAMMEEPHPAGDPQIMQNVLQVQDADGGWRNVAQGHAVQATGWSWAAKFGDLDRDGFLDLYVVNGMIASNLFGHLPFAELVEENQAFRNQDGARFVLAPQWGLGSTASGRGMVMADLDNDGDLDIVVNNLRRPALLFENRLCGGSSLAVDLRAPDSDNPYAVGAQLRLLTSQGALMRDLRAGGGYLSGDPLRVHFGFAADATLHSLEIVWPDGARSQVDAPARDALLTVWRDAPGETE